MKISRSDPVRRRRRNPLRSVLILIVLILAGLLALAWTRGGDQAQKQVEIVLPADRLGK